MQKLLSSAKKEQTVAVYCAHIMHRIGENLEAHALDYNGHNAGNAKDAPDARIQNL